MQMTSLTRLVRRLLEPWNASWSTSPSSYAAVEAAPLRVCRLEERRVLAADPLAGIPGSEEAVAAALGGDISTLATPVITVPASQSTTEGAALLFSPSTGREIRVDAPGLGTGPLRLDISATYALGQVTPTLGFGTTAGLSVTGNGVNAFQLQGTLPNINAALASLTFYSPDNGSFTINLVATDPATGQNDNASISILVTNVAPQVSAANSIIADEGSIVEHTIVISDAGAFDNPQVNWTVSHRGAVVASGSGPAVTFLAAKDGEYELDISAYDKDGGASDARQFISILNVKPSVALTGAFQNGVVTLNIAIDDPGEELFLLDIYWTGGSAAPESIVTSNHVLSVSHKYTPEELAQAGELTVVLQVADNASFDRQTLQFREGGPIMVERSEFTAPPRETPPQRSVSPRPQVGGANSQIVSADLGGAVTHGALAAPSLYQFVLRVVGPDGEESESYPIAADALSDLPAYLTRLGVPDGHYRIYLIAGDLERLVIDGHLRAGHIVDPTDASQNSFDFPRGEVAAQQVPGQRGANVSDSSAAVSQAAAGVESTTELAAAAGAQEIAAANLASTTVAAAPVPVADPTTAAAAQLAASSSTNEWQHDENVGALAMPVIGGTIAIGAASTFLFSTATRRTEKTTASRMFSKRARLARKLARQRPTTAF